MDKYDPYQSPQPIGYQPIEHQQVYQSTWQPGMQRPGQATAIAVMVLVGGILAVFSSGVTWVYLTLATCGFGILWPGPYFGIVMGILAIVKGSKLLGDHQGMEGAPTGIAIMQIINIINCDVMNMVLGIIVLVFLNSPECQVYYRAAQYQNKMPG